MKRIALFLLVVVLTATHKGRAEELTVASFNIRYQNSSDSVKGNGWNQRLPYVCDLIRFHNFEVFGAQEVLHNQLGDILKYLPDYDYVGVGRDDGKTKGEYAPIFYQKKKFRVLESGHFWLAEDTSKPNKGWDAALPRICTWAKLENRTTGMKFFFFNLHMDHVGVEARKNSARLVLNKVIEMCDELPVILAGDFNVDQHSPNYAILEGSELLNDAFNAAEIRYAPNGTFNNFRPDMHTGSRIDHVFVSPHFKVLRYGVLTDSYRTEKEGSIAKGSGNFPREVKLTEYVARTPSDHFPVMVVLDVR